MFIFCARRRSTTGKGRGLGVTQEGRGSRKEARVPDWDGGFGERKKSGCTDQFEERFSSRLSPAKISQPNELTRNVGEKSSAKLYAGEDC